MTVRRVSFPLMGSYHIAEKALAEGIGAEVVLPPPLTKRTLELGTKYSPEAICVPFKYVLGNFIEAIERGANAVIQVGGGCRLGCYAELQRAILTSLGYEVDYLTIGGRNTIPEIFGFIRRYYPNLSLFAIVQALYRAFEKARAIDDFEDVMRKNIGFEVKAGSFERLQKRFLAELDQASALRDIWRVRREYLEDVRQIEVDKPEHPLRVGFVGEFYVVLEPFSNFFIEKHLAKFGVEVHRPLTVAHTIRDITFYDWQVARTLRTTRPYVTGRLGGEGTENVASALRYAKQGFDGLIHVKPFGCMPEISAMPALYRISEDFHFPIVYFSFDSLTSETGIKTRLEAFYDMMVMRKERHA